MFQVYLEYPYFYMPYLKSYYYDYFSSNVHLIQEN